MRIAYVCADSGIPVLGHKGASVHVREFTDALVELGHAVRIIAVAGGDRNPAVVSPSSNAAPRIRAALSVLTPTNQTELATRDLADTLLRLSLPRNPMHLRSELRHLLADPEFATRALDELRTFEPDLVIARHALFSVAGAEIARELGRPLVLEVNAPLTEERRRYWGLTLDDVAEEAERAAFRAADLVVAVSEGVRAYVIRSGAPAERVIVLPNGVDVSRFHPGVDPTPVRTRYRLADKLVVGFVGSLKPWHGVELLLHAFADVRTAVGRLERHAGPSSAPWQALHLLVVGDGPERESLRQLSEQLGIADAVTFTGAVSHDDVPEHLAAADIAVAPYRSSDGFYYSPLKVMEYLAMGRPVVAPMLGQIPSLLRGNGKATGILYRPDDRHELGDALLRLSRDRDLRRRLGENGSEHARRCLSWRRVATSILDRVAPPEAPRGEVGTRTPSDSEQQPRPGPTDRPSVGAVGALASGDRDD